MLKQGKCRKCNSIVEIDTDKSQCYCSTCGSLLYKKKSDAINQPNVIAIKCVNCGGDISMPEDKKYTNCPYCGTLLAYDDGSEKIEVTNGKDLGYQQELGRQQVIADIGNGRQFTLAKIQEIETYFASNKNDFNLAITKNILTTKMVIWLIVLAILFCATIVVPVICIALFILFLAHDISTGKKRAIAINNIKQKYKDNPNLTIGLEYIYPTTLNKIKQYVVDGRADTLKEAINLYQAEIIQVQTLTALNKTAETNTALVWLNLLGR